MTRPLTEDQRKSGVLEIKNTTTYTYEPTYHLPRTTSWYPSEEASTLLRENYEYTAQGRVQSVTNAAGEITNYSYEMSSDGNNRLFKVISEKVSKGKTVAKNAVTYGSDTQYSYPTLEEAYFNVGQPNSKVVRKITDYNIGTGLIHTVKDGNNQTTTYSYDALGRPELIEYPQFTNQDGQKYSIIEKYTYKNNQISTNFDAENAGIHSLAVDSYRTIKRISNGAESTTHGIAFYDGFGQLLLEEKWDGYNGKFVKTQYHYDSLGRPINSVDESNNTLKVTYDAWGRQDSAQDAKGDIYNSVYNLKTRTNYSFLQGETEQWNNVYTKYDAWGNKIEATAWLSSTKSISEKYKYDSAGNLVAYTDPNGNVNDDGVTTSYVYDELGRLSKVKDALNQTTRYQYDGNGQISKVTVQAKNGIEQTLNSKDFNEIGLLHSKLDGASQSETYDYNALGQLDTKTDRNGSNFTYVYDESGKLKSSKVSRSINGSVQTQESRINFGESGPTNHTTKTFTNNQQTGSQTQTLDTLGQVRSTYSISGNHSANIINQYDVLGRLTSVQDQYFGLYTQYQYNKMQLQKVQTNGSSTITDNPSVNVTYSYYPNNLVDTITYPTLTDGTVLKTKYTYNKVLNWTESMENTKGNEVLSRYRYEYDNNGNRIAVHELRKGDLTEKTTRYKYDGLDRLISIIRPDGSQTMHTYDLRGNRLTLSDTNAVNLNLADTSYTYDLQNTLTSVTKSGASTSFQYYADGMRFMKTKGNTETQVNYNLKGQVISEEKLVSGKYVERANYVRGDRVLVKKDKNVQTNAVKDYYYLYNGHGDVVQIVDTSGVIVNYYNYDEWGNITNQVEGTSNSFKYTGEVYDAETGLYYLRARYYDPSMGRFLNEDTYEGQIDNPLSLNLYTYVHNNPLIYSDPTGHYTDAGGASGGDPLYNLSNTDATNKVILARSSNATTQTKILKSLTKEYKYGFFGDDSGGMTKNQFEYLYKLATSAGLENYDKAIWAIAQLDDFFYSGATDKTTAIAATVGAMGAGMISGGGGKKIKLLSGI